METLTFFSSNLLWFGIGFLVLLFIVFYKITFKIFGIIIVPEDKIGLIIKKFSLGEFKSLTDGRVVATKGEAGMQAKTLAPGLYFGYWMWQYSITLHSFQEIPSGKIGLIQAKDGKPMPTGQILGQKVECEDFQNAEKFLVNGGTKGRQTSYLTAGLYRINPYLFEVQIEDMVHVSQAEVGIVTTLDGEPLPQGQIAGAKVEDHNNFQNSDTFLQKKGSRGLQSQVILAGSYNINRWFANVERVEMTKVSIGNVGVVISYFGDEGEDQSGETFEHGNIVKKNQKGVWATPLDPGKYAINPYIMKIESVPTTNIVLNWADARTESHNLDSNLSTIKVRSKDGFEFNVDVSQIIHIPANEAPKVIARFGSVQNLVSQVLEPTVGNYFRNSAQAYDVIDFLKGRKERQDEAKKHIEAILKQYNVKAVDTLIGDFVPPEKLMKTLTDRKIAEEMNVTYKTEMEAQKTRQELEKQTAIANLQSDIQTAEQGVQIAEKKADAKVKEATGNANAIKLEADAKAHKTKVEGTAEAEIIEAKGKALGSSYEDQVKSMGPENYALFKIFETVGEKNIKITPELIVGGNSGSGNSSLEGLLALQLFEKITKEKINSKPNNTEKLKAVQK